MLTIYCSNRFEVLADRVAERLDRSSAGPFTAHHLIVPSTAVRRAISLHLARRDGISANLNTSFLAQWLWTRVAAVVPGVMADSPYAARRLGWRLESLLEAAAADHPRLAAYLASSDALMRHDLAMQVAERFEQYTTYRPDWLTKWEQGQRVFQDSRYPDAVQHDEQWQAALWQRLQHQIQPAVSDPIEQFVRTLNSLHAEGWQALGQPSQVQLLALPNVPPQHARLLGALSGVMDVHVHVINPCREYWFDLVDAQRLSHLDLQAKSAGYEIGHPLLASWGKQTQSSLSVLVDAFANQLDDDGGYRESARPTLLGRLQDSILRLSSLEPGSLPPAHGDTSLEIHACHSLSRQLEVLHGRLLSAFAEPGSDLTPADVLIVVPDLEAAAPVIEAIFGTMPRERQLPYRISGLSGARTNPVARALLALLSCVTGRSEISRLLDLLSQDPIARSLELTSAEHERLTQWLTESGVHWGLDAAHRSGFPGSAHARHTLADGLDRLFLSYALPNDTEAGYMGIWPSASVEGSDSLTLGKLSRFSRQLTDITRRVGQPLLASHWKNLIESLPDRFMEVRPQDFEDLQSVRRSLTQMFQEMSGHDPDQPIPATVMLRSLQEALTEPARGGVPTGVITFAAPGSLRYLPFRIIAFAGLDDGAFTGRSQTQEFDLLTHAPRMGDRQRRDDERNLFLDLLLAARDRFILTYTGFSIRDNSPTQPSLLVSELLDALTRACPDDVRQAIVVEHPLQAFDRRAFLDTEDARIRSHDARLARVWQQASPLRAQGRAADGPAPFFAPPSSARAARALSLEALIEILNDPASALLKAQTGIRFEREPEPLQDDEPLITSKRTLRQIQRRASRRLLLGAPVEPLMAKLQNASGVATGWLGEQPVQERLQQVQAYVLRIQADLAASDAVGSLPAPSLDLTPAGLLSLVPGIRTDHLRSSGLILALDDRREEQALLTGWIQHLALLSWAPSGIRPQTRVHTLTQTFTFGMVENPRERLAALLDLAQRALHEPIPFLPTLSLAFARKPDLSIVEDLWSPRLNGQWAESDRPEIQRVWRGRGSPLNSDTFEPLALEVFGPLLNACVCTDV